MFELDMERNGGVGYAKTRVVYWGWRVARPMGSGTWLGVWGAAVIDRVEKRRGTFLVSLSPRGR
jgi:hypothetical protein